MNTPPKTSVISSPQGAPVPPYRRLSGRLQYGARMKSPSPCSYHQNATAVPRISASSALATRLRSSLRCAMSVIVAAASRGGRRRRRGRPPSVTERSEAAVGRAGLVGAGAQLRGPCLRSGGLGLGLGRGVDGRRRRADGRRDLADRGGGGGVLAADVVVLHALHLALEDPQRAAERAGCVGQLLVPEQQQDGQDDQADLHRTQVHVRLPVTCRSRR